MVSSASFLPEENVSFTNETINNLYKESSGVIFPKTLLEVSLPKESLETPLPKIFICSRTHRQITQLVKELGSTSYRPKMAVLGSRNHLCLQSSALNSQDPNEKWQVYFSNFQ